jgi:protein farnesyltransferase/geranylgeranyltransferase type-1 subunit alpha
MGYFRAISAQEERSQRALDVTLRVIRLNPAHYTVWCVLARPDPSVPRGLVPLLRRELRRTRYFLALVCFSRQYRFKTLIALGASLEDELDLMTQLAEDNMKSYQVW